MHASELLCHGCCIETGVSVHCSTLVINHFTKKVWESNRKKRKRSEFLSPNCKPHIQLMHKLANTVGQCIGVVLEYDVCQQKKQ